MTVKLIGADDATGSSAGSNCVYLTRFQAVATGQVTEFRVKVTGTAIVKIAIYADSSGEPGARLSYNDAGQGAWDGWNTLTIPALDVTSGTYYWLAIISSTDVSGYTLCISGDSSNFRYKAQNYNSWTWPDPAGSGYSSGSYLSLIAGWGTVAPYELSCTDGFKIGEVVATQCSFGLVCTDGLKGGDNSAGAGVFSKVVSDGLKVGDIPVGNKISSPIVTDGFKLGDVSEESAYGVRIRLHSAMSQRRYKTSDFSAFTFPDPAGVGFTSVNDGYSMLAGWGGSPTVQFSSYPTLIDGVKLSDVASVCKSIYVILTDGLKMGETVLVQKVLNVVATDGLKLSEALATQKITFPTVTDGVKLSDQTLGGFIYNLLLTDGFILSDETYTIGVAFVPPGIYLIEIHNSDGSLVAVLNKVYEISLEETVNSPTLLTISIPADDTKLSYITRARELWVRDIKTNTIISKTKLLRKDDVRN